MKLELETGPTVNDPDAMAIEKSLASVQGFAILSKDRMSYIQASGSAKDGFSVEYQEGDTEHHYKCADCLSLQQVTEAFASYAQADDAWRTSLKWQREEEPTLPPSIRSHIGGTTLFEIAGSIGAPAAFVAYKFLSGQPPSGVVDGILFFGLFILGYLVPRAVFRHLIGAACPASSCRGSVFPKGTKPVIYVCKACGRSYPTELFEGSENDGMGR